MMGTNLRTLGLVVLSVQLCTGGAFVSGFEHPNYGVQFPPHEFTPADWVLGEEDVSFLEALLAQYPQSNIAIDWERRLVGYLDPTNPAKVVIWTPFPSSLRPQTFSDSYLGSSVFLAPVVAPQAVAEPIPEPSTLGSVPVALVILFALRRRLRA